jgi:hypothetical protein
LRYVRLIAAAANGPRNVWAIGIPRQPHSANGEMMVLAAIIGPGRFGAGSLQ